jgi:hypothetical protein
MGCIYRDGIVVAGDDGLCSPYDESSPSLAPLPVDESDYRFDLKPNDGDAFVGSNQMMKDTSTSNTSSGCDQNGKNTQDLLILFALFGFIWRRQRNQDLTKI